MGKILLALLIANPRFTPSVENPAVVLLKSTNGRCTGSFISKSGHILTARHCLQNCLIQSGVFQMRSEQNAITYFEIDSSRLGKAKCDLEINGREETIVIDATSPGYIAKVDEPGFAAINLPLFQRLVEEGYTSRGDFVIAHIESSPVTACLTLAEKSPAAGESVHTIGYPSETHRPDSFNSQGHGAYASTGKVISSIDENECLKEVTDKIRLVEEIRTKFNEPTSLLSTLDSVYGASGSPVLNEQGKVAGILTNVYKHSWLTGRGSDAPEFRYCSGSSKALKTDQIRNLISGELKSRFCGI